MIIEAALRISVPVEGGIAEKYPEKHLSIRYHQIFVYMNIITIDVLDTPGFAVDCAAQAFRGE